MATVLGLGTRQTHSGGIWGFASLMIFLPDRKMSVVVLTNAAFGEPPGASSTWQMLTPAPEPMLLKLVDDDDGIWLDLGGTDRPALPLAEAVRTALRDAGGPTSRAVLRAQLAVNNARLGDALTELGARGLAHRGPRGWTLAQRQLALVE